MTAFDSLNERIARVATTYVEARQYLILSTAASNMSVCRLLYGPVIFMKKGSGTLAGYAPVNGIESGCRFDRNSGVAISKALLATRYGTVYPN